MNVTFALKIMACLYSRPGEEKIFLYQTVLSRSVAQISFLGCFEIIFVVVVVVNEGPIFIVISRKMHKLLLHIHCLKYPS